MIIDQDIQFSQEGFQFFRHKSSVGALRLCPPQRHASRNHSSSDSERCRWTTSLRRRGRAIRASSSACSCQRQDGDPADQAARWDAGLEDRHSDEQGHPRPAGARRLGMDQRPVLGHMRFVLGDQDWVLGPVEVASFDTRVPHWFGSTGDEPAEILSIFGRPGERMTVRTTPP